MSNNSFVVPAGSGAAAEIEHLTNQIEQFREHVSPHLPKVEDEDFEEAAVSMWSLCDTMEVQGEWLRAELAVRIFARIVRGCLSGPARGKRRRHLDLDGYAKLLRTSKSRLSKLKDAYLLTHPAAIHLFDGCDLNHPYMGAAVRLADDPEVLNCRHAGASIAHYENVLAIAKAPSLGPEVARQLVDEAMELKGSNQISGSPTMYLRTRTIQIMEEAGLRRRPYNNETRAAFQKIVDGILAQQEENIERFLGMLVAALCGKGLLGMLKDAIDNEVKADKMAVNNAARDRLLEFDNEKAPKQEVAQPVGRESE